MNSKFFHALMALVRDVLKFNSPADKLLSNFFRENKKLLANERTIVADTVYAILRNYYKLTSLVHEHTPNLIVLTWLKLLNFKPDELSQFKNIDIQALNAMEFKNDESSRLELPQWMLERLCESYTSSEVEAIALSMQNQASLDLRVNLIKNDFNTVFNKLTADKLEPQKTEFSSLGIRLTNKTFLAKHSLFLDGSIEVQDESSQLAGLLLMPKRGEMVVDFCAGSGGKTLLFGSLMRNSGRIYAFDNNERRLNNLTPRLSRSGLSNVYPQLIAHENDSKIKRLYNKIDSVFVDAPCTGLGTLRRNPELKFRQTETVLNEMNNQQSSILNAASKLVKINGHLVYATCSILRQENQDIVNTFLAKNSGFRLVPANTRFDDPKLINKDGFLKLLPHIHNTDGFFAALIQRIS